MGVERGARRGQPFPPPPLLSPNHPVNFAAFSPSMQVNCSPSRQPTFVNASRLRECVTTWVSANLAISRAWLNPTSGTLIISGLHPSTIRSTRGRRGCTPARDACAAAAAAGTGTSCGTGLSRLGTTICMRLPRAFLSRVCGDQFLLEGGVPLAHLVVRLAEHLGQHPQGAPGAARARHPPV